MNLDEIVRVYRPTGIKASISVEPTLSIIIITFNTRDLTLGAIASILSQTDEDTEIIVVDNASMDGSAAQIRASFPQVTLVEMPQNLGFGRANNLASTWARGRYLLLVNSDTIVLPGTIAALLDFAGRKPEAKIWGGRTLTADGKLDPRSCSRRPTLWSVAAAASGLTHFFPASPLCNPEAMPNWSRDDERCVDIVSGCLLMIGRKDWSELRGFDPAFFMYGEEVDLCLRARRQGAMPAICPSATIIHFVGASQPAAPRMAQILAGRIRVCHHHLSRGEKWIAIWIIRTGVILRYWLFMMAPARSVGRLRLQQVYRLRDYWWNGYLDHDGQDLPVGA